MSNPILNLLDNAKDLLHASFLDVHGNPTTPAGPITWSVDQTTLLSLAPGGVPAGSDCEITALGPIGVATVTCASVNAAGAPITAAFDIHIQASGPTTIALSADAPMPQ